MLAMGCSDDRAPSPPSLWMADAGTDSLVPINNLPVDLNNEPEELNNNQGECHIQSLKPFNNRCAIEHDFGPGWESGDLGPAPGTLGLQLAWIYENQCPVPYNSYFTSLVVQNTTLTTTSGSWLATLDRTNGTELACQFLGREFEDANLAVIAALPPVFVFAVEAYFFQDIQEAIQWKFLDPLNPDPALAGSLPGCGGHFDGFRLTPDGQFIAVTQQPDGLISVDPLTGETNWVVDGAELVAGFPAGSYPHSTRLEMGFDKTTREVIIKIEPNGTVGVDPCGKVSRRDDAIAATVVEFGTDHLELTRGRLRVVSADGTVVSDEACEQMISLSESVFACAKRGEKRAVILWIYEIGQEKRKIEFSPPLESMPTIATRDGVLLMPSQTRIRFYDWRAEKFISGYEFSTEALTRLHDVSANGQIIMTRWKEVVVVDSLLTGLAPGPFPRGFDTAPPGALVPW